MRRLLPLVALVLAYAPAGQGIGFTFTFDLPDGTRSSVLLHRIGGNS